MVSEEGRVFERLDGGGEKPYPYADLSLYRWADEAMLPLPDRGAAVRAGLAR